EIVGAAAQVRSCAATDAEDDEIADGVVGLAEDVIDQGGARLLTGTVAEDVDVGGFVAGGVAAEGVEGGRQRAVASGHGPTLAVAAAGAAAAGAAPCGIGRGGVVDEGGPAAVAEEGGAHAAAPAAPALERATAAP